MIFRMVSVLLLLPLLLAAQQAPDTTHTALVTVRSHPSGAAVFLDTVYAGMTPLERFRLLSGEHEVRVFYPSASQWNAFMLKKSLLVTPGSDIESSFEFGTVLSLHSVPSGAIVSFRGTALGRTPLFYRSDTAMSGSLTLEMPDYESVSVPVQEKPLVVQLEPLRKSDQLPEFTIEYPAGTPQRKWVTIGSAAAMVVSGVAAAYFKDRANRDFDLYSSTSDPALLSSTHRYDRLSLVSLIVTQAAFALLTYSLLSDH